MSNVAEALSRLTPEQRAILEKKLQINRSLKESTTEAKSGKIGLRPDEVGNPLSAGQERLLMLSQFAPDATTYNIAEAVRLRGRLDTAALEKSLSQVVQRHKPLCAIFPEVDGTTQQIIQPFDETNFTVTQLASPDQAEQTTCIQRFISAELAKPFILDQGPLYRFSLLAISDSEHILILTMHHIIADAWSFGILFKELSSRYVAIIAGHTPAIEPLPIQYADFAHWQREWLKSDKAQRQLTFWAETLAPRVEPLQLPNSPSKPPQDDESGAVRKNIAPELTQTLQSISRDAGTTLFITLLAGFKTALYRYTGQTDMIVCSPTVGRKQVETEELIGYFNNIISVRTDLSGNPNMKQIQERIQDSLLAAYDHDELPFQQVASLPHLARVPLTRALFTLQDGLNEALVLPGIEHDPIDLPSNSSDFDIALYMEWHAGNLVAILEYKPEIIDQGTANDLLEKLYETLQIIANNPTISLNDFSQAEHLGHRQASANYGHGVISNAVESTPTANGPLPNESNGTVQKPTGSTSSGQHGGSTPESDLGPDELEVQLIKIWEEVLSLEEIRPNDNFFELGGHSMSALRLFTKIEQEVTQEKLPLALLFQAPTVADIAKVIRGDDTQAAWSLMVPLQETGSKPPLFCIHAAGGNVLLYNDLARHLAGTDQPIYGIQAQGLDGKKPILKTVEEMGEVYVKEILAVQPTGPYLLAGYCLGGTVAFDVAQRLTNRGHHVAFLGLLETYNWANLKGASVIGNLKYQSQRAEFMVRNFMMLDPAQRQDFFRGKLERVQDRTSVWRGSIQSKLSRNPDEATKNEDAILAELWESNDAAADAYVPTTYSGKITQFIPAKDYAEYDNPDLLWDSIAQGGVDVHKLQVYPAGMVYEPYVRTLAHHMAESIDIGLSGLEA